MDDFIRFFKRDDSPPRRQKQTARTDNYTESLQKRVNFLEKENRNLKIQVADFEHQIIDLNRTISHLKLIQSTNPLAMKAMQDDLVQDLKFEIKTMCSQLQNFKEANQAYQAECNELNQKYQELLNELDSEKAASQVEITRLKNLVTKLRKEGAYESNVRPERMSGVKANKPKTPTPEEQYRKLIESSEDFYIEEAESLPEKDREIMDLKAEIRNLKALTNNPSKGNSGTLVSERHSNARRDEVQGGHAQSGDLSALDTQFFKGTLLGSDREGFGMAIDKDNRVSVGRFERGKLQGFAKLLIDDQMIIGNFVDGKLEESSCKVITFPVHKRVKFNELMEYEGETISGTIEGKGRLFFGQTSYFEGFFKKGNIDTTRKGLLHVESSAGLIEVEVSVLFFAALNTAVFSASNGLTFACNLKTGLLERQS